MVEEEEQEEDIKLNKGWHGPASPARPVTVPPSPLLPPRKRGVTASREERESGAPPSPNTRAQAAELPSAGDPWVLCPRMKRGRSKDFSPPEYVYLFRRARPLFGLGSGIGSKWQSGPGDPILEKKGANRCVEETWAMSAEMWMEVDGLTD
ncbi:hypothetical protein Sjap_023164 [Stephania japonica]|uniref:Uncharacterized protein n=1 Tax=Stephania japonica TaxID=461633 RepID=A0AAP0EFQ9_9MAGN